MLRNSAWCGWVPTWPLHIGQETRRDIRTALADGQATSSYAEVAAVGLGGQSPFGQNVFEQLGHGLKKGKLTGDGLHNQFLSASTKLGPPRPEIRVITCCVCVWLHTGYSVPDSSCLALSGTFAIARATLLQPSGLLPLCF